MKLTAALLQSIKEHGNFSIIYKDTVYHWDPYDFEKEGTAGKFTEFRCNIGSFGEFLLWNHPNFAPKMKDFFKDVKNPTDEEMNLYSAEKIKNMFMCNDFEVAK